jgi:ribosomal protein L19E
MSITKEEIVWLIENSSIKVTKTAEESNIILENVKEEDLDPQNDVEIDINISKSDLKALSEGKTIEMKDKAGTHMFTVKVKARES